jgi:hypothetical protein
MREAVDRSRSMVDLLEKFLVFDPAKDFPADMTTTAGKRGLESCLGRDTQSVEKDHCLVYPLLREFGFHQRLSLSLTIISPSGHISIVNSGSDSWYGIRNLYA